MNERPESKKLTEWASLEENVNSLLDLEREKGTATALLWAKKVLQRQIEVYTSEVRPAAEKSGREALLLESKLWQQRIEEIAELVKRWETNA